MQTSSYHFNYIAGMFVTVGALASLPKNITVTLNITSNDDVGAQLLSPVVTINLFGSSGDKLSYNSDEPLVIDIPVVVSCKL